MQLVEWQWFVDSRCMRSRCIDGPNVSVGIWAQVYSCVIGDSNERKQTSLSVGLPGRRFVLFGYYHNVVAEQVDLSLLLSL